MPVVHIVSGAFISLRWIFGMHYANHDTVVDAEVMLFNVKHFKRERHVTTGGLVDPVNPADVDDVGNTITLRCSPKLGAGDWKVTVAVGL